MTEFEYISWLRRRSAPHPRVLVGPGDDCAVLARPDSPLLVTTDMIMDGVHFRLAETDPRRVGRKAMAVNLSDIAAMAGIPVAAVVSVALPRTGPEKLGEDLYLGLRDMADAFQTAIAGGDTNAWDGPLTLSVTLLGQAGPHGAVLRSGARPGDWLMVTGPLGGSLQGKHLDFTPRIREGQMLAEAAKLHAMIDISDGLAADANHLAEESGVAVVLTAEAVPIAPAALTLQDGRTPLQHALSDGEDFELLFAVSPEDGRRLLAAQPLPGITLSHVGTCEAGAGLFLEEGGIRKPLAALGYVHEF